MSETAVRVDLRHATLSESARLRETDGRVFLCLDNPPPVRSLLRITIGDEQRVFEVGRVIEVADETDTERGCHGTFVAVERLKEQLEVGSEHLQPQINSNGVPAPVVIMNTNEMLLAEAGGEDSEILAEARAEAASEQTINDTETSEQSASEPRHSSESEQTISDSEPNSAQREDN